MGEVDLRSKDGEGEDADRKQQHFFCAYTPTSASPVLFCTSSSCPVRLESRAM